MKPRKLRIAVLLLLISVLSVGALAQGQMSPSDKFFADYTEKLTTPDLLQTDQFGGLPGGGQMYCAPVSVANSFVWLAQNGYNSLVPDFEGGERAWFRCARNLGKKNYMRTSTVWGTSVSDLLYGVRNYVADSGYEIESLEYQGWRSCPSQFFHSKYPDPEWIKTGLLGNTAVWLNIGWYDYSPSKKTYHRDSGHWVTLVGFGFDKDGMPDPNMLIIHDPAHKGVKSYGRLEMIESGTLGRDKWSNRPAEGYFMLTEDYKRRGNKRSILDGVVVLKLRSTQPQLADSAVLGD